MNLNLTPPTEQVKDDGDRIGHHFPAGFGLNHHLAWMASSSSSVSCFSFDPAGYYRQQLPQPHQQEDHDRNYVYGGGSSCKIEHKANCGIQLSPWNKEEYHHHHHQGLPADNVVWQESENISHINWMSPKTKSTQKAMKSKQKLQPSSSCLESELSSNGPIRVCSDCNTTKTPLWRSGPKGPKSLCNACGIRQRKARRAMAVAAAAAAAGGGAAVAAAYEKPPPKLKIKENNKKGKRERMKKRSKMAASEGGDQKKKKRRRRRRKTHFEDFLINLSNSLAFHRVFPQDEKDAAILLMALSSGLVNG